MPAKRVRCRHRWNLVMLPHQTRTNNDGIGAANPLVQEWRFPARNRNGLATQPKTAFVHCCAKRCAVWSRCGLETVTRHPLALRDELGHARKTGSAGWPPERADVSGGFGVELVLAVPADEAAAIA